MVSRSSVGFAPDSKEVRPLHVPCHPGLARGSSGRRARRRLQVALRATCCMKLYDALRETLKTGRGGTSATDERTARSAASICDGAAFVSRTSLGTTELLQRGAIWSLSSACTNDDPLWASLSIIASLMPIGRTSSPPKDTVSARTYAAPKSDPVTGDAEAVRQIATALDSSCSPCASIAAAECENPSWWPEQERCSRVSSRGWPLTRPRCRRGRPRRSGRARLDRPVSEGWRLGEGLDRRRSGWSALLRDVCVC